MKRGALYDESLLAPPSAGTSVDLAWQPETNHRSVCHCLFLPLHYEANYAYPLLVWLHGPGDDQRQVKRIMPLVSLRNYVAVGARGTWMDQDDDLGQGGFTWRQTDHDILLASQRVADCIQLASERCHIAPERIFLAGYDAGGTMALRLAMAEPEKFAGVVSLCGRFPQGHNPLARFELARRVPLLIAQGRDSESYTQDQVCRDLRLLHSAGMSVTLRQYPCGQEVTTLMLADVDAWVMQRVTGVEPASSPDESCLRSGEWN